MNSLKLKFLTLVTGVAMLGANPDAYAAEKAEIYKLMPNTALSGVVDPEMPDRSAINKALPKTPKDPKKIVIGWTEITLGNPWFVGVADGAKKKAAEYGYEINMQVADGDVQKQSADRKSVV